MTEPIRTKRYVCAVCSGSGKNPVFEVIFGVEKDPPEEEKFVDCTACIRRGLPPFVDLPLPGQEVTVK